MVALEASLLLFNTIAALTGSSFRVVIQQSTNVIFLVLFLSFVATAYFLLRSKLRPFILSTVLLGVCVAWVFNIAPILVDRGANTIETKPAEFPPIPAHVQEAFDKLPIVADAHADTLLWTRDINEKADYGHVDVPRLLSGNIGLQGFTIVTGVPKGQNFQRNEEPALIADSVTHLGIIQRWPAATISSRAARTVYQAQKLHDFAKNSNGVLHVLTNAEEMARYKHNRKSVGHNITAGFLGIEGLHALDEDVTNVQKFIDVGIRMMGPSHFFDNAVGGSAHGIKQEGLTAFGDKVIQEIIDRGILLDLAHASPTVMDDVLDLAEGKQLPVLNSHTGVHAVCPSPRNMRDNHIERVAKTGGAVCVTYFRPAQCGDGTLKSALDSIVKSIRHVVNLVGVEHVCLGSDFDGAVSVPFDTSQVAYLYEALLNDGFSAQHIQLIMGDNLVRVLSDILNRF